MSQNVSSAAVVIGALRDKKTFVVLGFNSFPLTRTNDNSNLVPVTLNYWDLTLGILSIFLYICKSMNLIFEMEYKYLQNAVTLVVSKHALFKNLGVLITFLVINEFHRGPHGPPSRISKKIYSLLWFPRVVGAWSGIALANGLEMEICMRIWMRWSGIH